MKRLSILLLVTGAVIVSVSAQAQMRQRYGGPGGGYVGQHNYHNYYGPGGGGYYGGHHGGSYGGGSYGGGSYGGGSRSGNYGGSIGLHGSPTIPPPAPLQMGPGPKTE